MTILGLTPCQGVTSRNSRHSSVSTLAEVSVLHGSPNLGLQLRVEHYLCNRLQKSSQSTINTVWSKHWTPFCDLHSLAYFVPTGCPNRGGIMAAFLVTLATKQLAYSTVHGYIWAVVEKHLQHGFASPLANVRDWAPLLHGVEVEIGHGGSEPRNMLPWLLFVRVIPRFDPRSIAEMATLLTLLFIFFLVSRPELLPATRACFDTAKHLTRGKVRWIKGYLEVCMEKIKQDPLCKRPACISGKAWRAIGNGCQ